MTDAKPKRRARRRTARDELHDVRATLAQLSTAVASLQEQSRGTREARSKWGERVWEVIKVVIASCLTAAILYGAGWIRCTPPAIPNIPGSKFEPVEAR